MTNRTRNRDRSPIALTCRSVSYDTLGNVTADSTSETGEITHTESISDVVTPHYHRRIANGEIINNPCVYSVGDRTTGEGSLTYFYPSSQGGGPVAEHTGDVTGLHMSKWNFTFPPFPEYQDGTAEAKLHAVAQIDSTPYEFLEDVFEIRETLRFLRNPVRSLFDLSKSFAADLKRRQPGTAWPSAQEKADAIADIYLGYRFAVTPLVKSLQDGTEAVQSGYREAQRPARRTARGFRGFNDAQTEHVTEWNPAQTVSADVLKTHIWSRQFRTGILYEVTNPIKDASFILGLRAKDVPAGLWAVMPYSFMVDRCFDISSAIRGASNLLDPAVRILAGWSVEKYKFERTVKLSDMQHPDYPGEALTANTVVDSGGSYRRTVWYPSMSDTIPTLELGQLVKDLTSTADIVALTYRNFLGN